jgi:hypothetical protein
MKIQVGGTPSGAICRVPAHRSRIRASHVQQTVENFPSKQLARPTATGRYRSRAKPFDAFYLRAAQAYMLISMPTGTSTIFGVFQLIRGPPKQCWHDARTGIKLGWPRA